MSEKPLEDVGPDFRLGVRLADLGEMIPLRGHVGREAAVRRSGPRAMIIRAADEMNRLIVDRIWASARIIGVPPLRRLLAGNDFTECEARPVKNCDAHASYAISPPIGG